MKKSRAITFTLMNSVVASAMAACGPQQVAVDPCNRATFNAPVCQQAVAQRGYDYNGVWYAMNYISPYDFYYHNYDTYRLGGGRVYVAPMTSYQHIYRSPDARANAFIVRETYGGGTSLSPSRMSGLGFSGRSGATTGRGGFGSIGAGHSSVGA